MTVARDNVEKLRPIANTTAISVTVGSGGDYSSINAALAGLSEYINLYAQGGVQGTITLLTGFEMSESVHVIGQDLGWIQIVAADAETTIIRSALDNLDAYQLEAFDTLGSRQLPQDTNVAFFGFNSVMPEINCLFTMDTSGSMDNNYIGLLLHGSKAKVGYGCGIKNVVRPTAPKDARAVNITHGSTLAGWGSVWSGSYIGVRASNASKTNVRSADISGCVFGIDANGVSEVAAQDADISGCTTHSVYCQGGSVVQVYEANCTGTGTGGTTDDYASIRCEGAGSAVQAELADVSGSGRGVTARYGGMVNFTEGTATACLGNALTARDGGEVYAAGATVSGTLSSGAVVSAEGGLIDVSNASIIDNTACSGLYAYGGEIQAFGATVTGNKLTAGDYDIRIRDGGIVHAYTVDTTNGGGTTVAVADTSVTRFNDRTSDGVLWHSTASILNGSKTHNFGSLADGAGETTTVTVTGAVLGDFVEGVSLSVDLQGMTLTGYVSAADTASVRLQNESGSGPINLDSGTLRVRVRKA